MTPAQHVASLAATILAGRLANPYYTTAMADREAVVKDCVDLAYEILAETIGRNIEYKQRPDPDEARRRMEMRTLPDPNRDPRGA